MVQKRTSGIKLSYKFQYINISCDLDLQPINAKTITDQSLSMRNYQAKFGLDIFFTSQNILSKQ